MALIRSFRNVLDRKIRVLLVFAVSFVLLGLGTFWPKAVAISPGLENLPGPFVTSGGVMNGSIVVASSVGHGPVGGAHTMDVMGAIIVASKLGMKTSSGMLEPTMDDYVSTYDFGTARITLKDTTTNWIVVGGPGVNQVSWYYNNLRNGTGDRVLPAYFDKDSNGTDMIRVVSTGHTYEIEHDAQGRTTADYGLILVFQDGGRSVMLLAGLGGSGTWVSCDVISTYESWSLHGSVAVVRYRDGNGDGLLDELSIVEQVPGGFSLSYVAPVGLVIFSAELVPRLKSLGKKILRQRMLSKVCLLLFLALVSQVSFTAFSTDLSYNTYTFKDFSHPFVNSGGLMNSSVVVASSVGHGPVGGAHTMDVMGAIVIASGLGMDAIGGSLSSTLDDYISVYDGVSARVSFLSLKSNLLVVGGPGVNQVSWYYNNLRNGTGDRVLPAYFDKDSNGTDMIRVVSTGHTYEIEHDAQGRTTADYGLIDLFYDANEGVWVLIAAGLGGSGTLAASRLIGNHKNWSLFGQAAVVKYADTNGDGYLDAANIVESVGVGQSIDVYSDPDCRNSMGSIVWGLLSPGEAKNVTVYVRNEGEANTVLSLSAYNWTPTEASNFMRITSDYTGAPLQLGQMLPLVVTLTVDQNISQITDFGVTIDINST